MRMIILGAPGAGKGTQAAGIATSFKIPAISTGAMFRENIAAGTPLGRQVAEILSAGHFVSDDITSAMVFERLGRDDAAAGFLLDGYPRTLAQVEALDAYLAERSQALDCVLELTVDTELVVARLLRRAQIEGRADDTEEVIRERMAIYREQTSPLTDVYRARGLLIAVDGSGEVGEVADRIATALAGRAA